MTYKETAKKLDIKYRIGKYGVEFGRHRLPDGGKTGWSLFHFVALDGWIFDPHEIIESIANDPAFSISYKEPSTKSNKKKG